MWKGEENKRPKPNRPSFVARAVVLQCLPVIGSRSLVGAERLDQAIVYQDGDEQVCQGLVELARVLIYLGHLSPVGCVHCRAGGGSPELGNFTLFNEANNPREWPVEGHPSTADHVVYLYDAIYRE